MGGRSQAWHAVDRPILCAHTQANDVEQALWKICYYRPIEDFRTRIKMATAAASGTAPQHGVTKEEAAKQVPAPLQLHNTTLQPCATRTLACCHSRKTIVHELAAGRGAAQDAD